MVKTSAPDDLPTGSELVGQFAKDGAIPELVVGLADIGGEPEEVRPQKAGILLLVGAVEPEGRFMAASEIVEPDLLGDECLDEVPRDDIRFTFRAGVDRGSVGVRAREAGLRGEDEIVGNVLGELDAGIVDFRRSDFCEIRTVEVASLVIEVEAECRASDVPDVRRVFREGIGQQPPSARQTAWFDQEFAAKRVELVLPIVVEAIETLIGREF